MEQSAYFVQFEAGCSESDLIYETFGPAVIALSSEQEVHWNPVGRRHHCLHVRLGRGARSRLRCCRWACAAANQTGLCRGNLSSLLDETERSKRTMPDARAWWPAGVSVGARYKSSVHSLQSTVADKCNELRARRMSKGSLSRDRSAELTVGVDGSGRDDQAFASDDFCVDANNHSWSDTLHHIRIASLSNTGDVAVVDSNVGLFRLMSV